MSSIGATTRGRSSSTERGRSLVPNNVLRQRSSSSGNVAANPAMVTTKGTTQRAPDFRKDKEENIKIVVNFLRDYAFPGPYNHKLLLSPSSKDYLTIFQFIYSLLDPGYELSSRPEDDIPTLYKSLGYPYTISRSALLTVATPHTWPLLLHALCWLIGLAQQTEWVSSTCDNLLEAPVRYGEGRARDLALFALYTEETYDQFMAGMNSFEAVDEQFLKNIIGPTEELDEARKLHEKVAKELQQLEQTKDCTGELETMLAQLEQSQAEILEYTANLSLHEQQLQASSGQQAEQLKAAKQELSEAEALHQRLQHEFDSQELSLQDVERMHQERSAIRRTIEALKQDVSAYNQKQWEAEMAITNPPVAAKCTKFNLALSRFVPGGDVSEYELKPAFGRSLHDDKSETVVKPMLRRLLQDSASATAAAAEANKACLKQITEASEDLAVRENDVLLRQSSLATLESNFNFEKQRLQGSIDSLQHQLASMQQELADLAEQKAQAVLTKEQLARSNYDARLSLEAKKNKNKQLESAVSNQLVTAVEMSLEAKAALEASVHEVVVSCKDTLTAMKSECEAARASYRAVLSERYHERATSAVSNAPQK